MKKRSKSQIRRFHKKNRKKRGYKIYPCFLDLVNHNRKYYLYSDSIKTYATQSNAFTSVDSINEENKRFSSYSVFFFFYYRNCHNWEIAKDWRPIRIKKHYPHS